MTFNPLSALETLNEKANQQAEDRANYRKTIDVFREEGWTEQDIAEYREIVAGIMSGQDEKAKEAARKYWKFKAE